MLGAWGKNPCGKNGGGNKAWVEKKPGLFEKYGKKSLACYFCCCWYEDFLFFFPSQHNVLFYTQKDISYLSKDVKERVFNHGLF